MPDSVQRTAKEIAARYGSFEDFAKAFNPSMQISYCQHAERCITGCAPTIAGLRAAYGKGKAVAWIVPQLYNLSEFCGCKDKLTAEQLTETAAMITVAYPWLKTMELMLFFFRLKSGRYGKFYGAVDPLTILTALREFVRERNVALNRIEQQQRERERARWKATAVSYEEYKAMKGAGHGTE